MFDVIVNMSSVGRTFVPDIFLHQCCQRSLHNSSVKTWPLKQKNTITQTQKHHHSTTTLTQPHNTTPRTTHTHSNTHIHRNTKTLKSVRSCLIPYVPAWQHVAITSHRPQKQVRSCWELRAVISLQAIAACFLFGRRSRSAEQDTDILLASKMSSNTQRLIPLRVFPPPLPERRLAWTRTVILK